MRFTLSTLLQSHGQPAVFCILSCCADAPRCTPLATPRSCAARRIDSETNSGSNILLAAVRENSPPVRSASACPAECAPARSIDSTRMVRPHATASCTKSSAHSWLSPVYWHTGALCQAQCFRFFRRSFRQASRYTRWTRLWCTFKSSNIAGSIDALLSQRVSSTIELHPTSIWATSEHRRSIFQVQCSPLKVLWFITFAF